MLYPNSKQPEQKQVSPDPFQPDLALFIKKMERENLSPRLQSSFAYYYRQFRDNLPTTIAENTINPVDKSSVIEIDDVESSKKDDFSILKRTVCIKLNGGLGTTMGCRGPKSLIPVKDGLSFLDIICKQLLAGHSSPVALLLLNSFKTDTLCRKELKKYPRLKKEIPQTFLQNKFPRIESSTFKPVSWPEDPQLEWNPPGHGDIYTALQSSGILNQLLNHDYKYAFISNIDNLGAQVHPAIPAYMETESIDFLMEVANRSEMDKKGGHIAQLNNGRLILREIAQCSPDDLAHFQNIKKHSFFNTNNIWINLETLHEKLHSKKEDFSLPMICTKKNIVPGDHSSTEMYQLETAMGTALSFFERSRVLRVSRRRFIPVKTTDDLFLLRSDFYHLSENFTVNPISDCPSPVIHLDKNYFCTLDQFEQRFSQGVPSLRQCTEFTVEGDFSFGKNIYIVGSVHLKNTSDYQVNIPDNTILNSDKRF